MPSIGLQTIDQRRNFLTPSAAATDQFEHVSTAAMLTLPVGPLDFEHNPGFLVGRLSRRISAEVDRRMREHGLTFGQAAVMARLWWQGGLTQSQLQGPVGGDGSTPAGC